MFWLQFEAKDWNPDVWAGTEGLQLGKWTICKVDLENRYLLLSQRMAIGSRIGFTIDFKEAHPDLLEAIYNWIIEP